MLVTHLYPFYFKATYFDFTQSSSHSTTTCPFVRGIKRTLVTCPETEAYVRKLYKPISQVTFLCSTFLTNYLLWFFFSIEIRCKNKILGSAAFCSLCPPLINLAEDLQRLWVPLWTWVRLMSRYRCLIWQPRFHFSFSYPLLTGELLPSLVACHVIFKKILHFSVLHY